MRSDDETNSDEIVRFGTIAEVDLANARVVVDTGDVKSGPVRWSHGRSGATRTWSPPSVGEQVLLFCPGGELSAAVAIGGISQDAFPPAGDSTRELMQFADGAVLAYDPEAHALEALLPAGATVKIEARGGVTIDATDGGLSIRGDVSIEGEVTVSGDVVASEISLVHHVHPDVAAGAAKTGEPE